MEYKLNYGKKFDEIKPVSCTGVGRVYSHIKNCKTATDALEKLRESSSEFRKSMSSGTIDEVKIIRHGVIENHYKW